MKKNSEQRQTMTGIATGLAADRPFFLIFAIAAIGALLTFMRVGTSYNVIDFFGNVSGACGVVAIIKVFAVGRSWFEKKNTNKQE